MNNEMKNSVESAIRKIGNNTNDYKKLIDNSLETMIDNDDFWEQC